MIVRNVKDWFAMFNEDDSFNIFTFHRYQTDVNCRYYKTDIPSYHLELVLQGKEYNLKQAKKH